MKWNGNGEIRARRSRMCIFERFQFHFRFPRLFRINHFVIFIFVYCLIISRFLTYLWVASECVTVWATINGGRLVFMWPFNKLTHKRINHTIEWLVKQTQNKWPTEQGTANAFDGSKVRRKPPTTQTLEEISICRDVTPYIRTTSLLYTCEIAVIADCRHKRPLNKCTMPKWR